MSQSIVYECRNPTLAKCGGEAQHLEKLGFGVLYILSQPYVSQGRGWGLFDRPKPPRREGLFNRWEGLFLLTFFHF